MPKQKQKDKHRIVNSDIVVVFSKPNSKRLVGILETELQGHLPTLLMEGYSEFSRMTFEEFAKL